MCTFRTLEKRFTINRCVNALHRCFLIVNLILISQCRSCQNPSSTVEQVIRCPGSLSEWIKASERKDCSRFTGNCTDSIKYEYHCVINAFVNATLEVCAPSTKIIGHRCAEFNALGEKMQENQESNCTACEYTYISTDSYKYQECYTKVRRQYPEYLFTSSTTKQIDEMKNDTRANIITEDTGKNQLYIIIGILSLLLVILPAAVFIIMCRMRRTNKANKEEGIYRADSEGISLNERKEETAELLTREGSVDELQDEKSYLPSKMNEKSPFIDLKSSIRTTTSDVSQKSSETIISDGDNKSPSVIAAIAFGEVVTKLAYSNRDNPLNIYTTSQYSGKDFEMQSALLLNLELVVLECGQEAYKKFHMTKETDKSQFLFFENVLNWEKREQDEKRYTIKASNNSNKEAKDVLQRFIGSVLETLKQDIEKQNLCVSDVNFVVTIPNNWSTNEDRRNLIREAVSACMVEVKKSQIHILKTADTIKPYLISRPSCVVHNLAPENMNFLPKTSFIVVHIGKAGFEFTLLKGCKDKDSPKLSHKCVKWEDTCVRKKWRSFLFELLGDGVRQLEIQKWEDYRNLSENIDFVQEYEENDKETLHLSLPRSLHKVIKEHSKPSFEKMIKKSNFKAQVKFENQELLIDRNFFRSFLKPAQLKLSKELKQWRQERKMLDADPTFVCMTGHYSKIHLFQEEIKTQFKKMCVMIPHNPDQVVVKGAVISGYEHWLPKHFDEKLRSIQSSFRESEDMEI